MKIWRFQLQVLFLWLKHPVAISADGWQAVLVGSPTMMSCSRRSFVPPHVKTSLEMRLLPWHVIKIDKMYSRMYLRCIEIFQDAIFCRSGDFIDMEHHGTTAQPGTSRRGLGLFARDKRYLDGIAHQPQRWTWVIVGVYHYHEIGPFSNPFST